MLKLAKCLHGKRRISALIVEMMQVKTLKERSNFTSYIITVKVHFQTALSQ